MVSDSIRYRIGCDIGGTFTDLILFDEESGRVYLEKVLTTPDDPAEAVIQGCQAFIDLDASVRDTARHIIHGTTLVINAVLQRSGAPTGLLTTEGFRDVLEMRRYMRGDMYDVFGHLPEPVVSRENRVGVPERVFANGVVLKPLDVDAARAAIRWLGDRGVTSFAVCLLHSYANNVHEECLRDLIREAYPEASISLSCEVLPVIGEYERTSSTVINAYTQPIVERYLQRLVERLEDIGLGCRLYLMQSGGGVTSVDTARRFPVRLVESGPVAGVVAASHFGRLSGARNVLSFDMGGTTAKAALIQDGQIPITSEYEIDRAHRFKRGSGLPVNLPTVDIIEVGTGGGSIAYIDDFGLVKVGPRSAGADPGPACYGRGGLEPTVTDADLVLGYLNADFFLGGKVRLDRNAAAQAIEQRIAKPLGTRVAMAAWGIVDIAREQMATAIRMHLAERGADPATTTIVGFGGAGPVHAFGLMRKVGAKQLIIPMGGGVMSALGMLMAPISYDLVRTHREALSDVDLEDVEEKFQSMEREAEMVLRTADSTGRPAFTRTVDLRYHGQGHELNLVLPNRGVQGFSPQKLSEWFHEAYERLYGYAARDTAVELVGLRVRAVIEGEPLAIPEIPATDRPLSSAVKGRRLAFDPDVHDFVLHTVYDRYALSPGMTFDGPAIIEERESTTIVGRAGRVSVDAYGSLIVSLVGKGDSGQPGDSHDGCQP